MGFGTIGVGHMSVIVDGIPHSNQRLVDSTLIYYTEYYFRFMSSITTYSYQFNLNPDLSVGLGVNYFALEMDSYKGSGSNVSIGLSGRFNEFNYSAFYENFYDDLKMTYNSGGIETIPTNFVFGLERDLNWINVYMQFKKKALFQDLELSFGTKIQPDWMGVLSVYFGYRDIQTILKKYGSFSIGLGMDIGILDLNYAYQKSDHIEFDHHDYFSFSLNL